MSPSSSGGERSHGRITRSCDMVSFVGKC